MPTTIFITFGMWMVAGIFYNIKVDTANLANYGFGNIRRLVLCKFQLAEGA